MPDLTQDPVEMYARQIAEQARAKLQQELAMADAKKGQGLMAPGAVAPEELIPTPGKERWAVKTANSQDQDRNNIDPTVKTVTVEDLLLIQRPDDIPFTQNNPDFDTRRSNPTETTIFQCQATIIAFKMEQDGDYHIVIQGTSGNTMIVEIPDPDPDFVTDSLFKDQITAARQAFDAQLGKGEAFMQQVSQPATITGIGFFDRMHGQTGVAQTNGLELHPVIGVSFGNSVNSGGNGGGNGNNGS